MGNELNRINATTKPRLLSIKEIEYVTQKKNTATTEGVVLESWWNIYRMQVNII